MTQHIPYNKPYKSSSDLIKVLKQRGLIITDEDFAENCLDNIGYYRLSAYMYPLLNLPKFKHQYKAGVTFDNVMTLYRFDKKLRLLMFNEIEKIEISIRRAVMQITADLTNDPFWLANESFFSNKDKFNETLHNIKREFKNSKEDFICHFREKYSDPLPPAWIIGELLTIGNVNAIYRNIKFDKIRKKIARHYSLPINVFESWLTIIAVTRNACCHHARIWNKQNAIPPANLNKPSKNWINHATNTMRVYFDLCIIKYFLHTISPNNDLKQKIVDLLSKNPSIDPYAMGFPKGWDKEPLWK